MPSQVALLLCLGLILVLFRLDARPKIKPSAALWIPTIWILINGSRMVSQWLDFNAGPATEEAYSEGSALDRNIFLILIVGAFFTVVFRRIRLSDVAKANPWLFLFWVYSGISIMWSDFPDVSFKRYIKDIGNTLMTLIVLSETAPVEAIVTVFKRCTYILIPLSIVMFKYYPNFGRSYGRYDGQLMITGVTNNKNSLGVLCALCGIVIFWSLVSSGRNARLSANKARIFFQCLMLSLTIWVLLLSHSATSLVCFLLGIFIITVIEMKVVRTCMIYALPAILLFLGTYTLLTGSVLGLFTGAVGRDETLTGRTDVWQNVIGMVQNPIIGCGYNSFFLGDRLKSLWGIYTWHLTEAHNGYLEIYLDLGVIGVILIFGVLLSSLKATFALVRNNPEGGALKLAILASAIIYNITESAFRAGLLMYFAFVLVVVRLPRSVKRPSWSAW